MNLSAYECLMQRKSVRDYTDQPVEPEKLQKIYDAILAAPTTENMMMYTVISVTDPEIRAKLSRQPAMRKAPVVLVFCADYRRWARIFQTIKPDCRKPEEGEYQLAVVIAAQNAVIAAETLGLSSVYLGDIMEHYEDRQEALGLPAGVVPVVTLCLGYAAPAQLQRAPVRRYRQSYLIHENSYQDFCTDELMNMLQDRGQYETKEAMQPWLEKFTTRSTDGKGAVERTRSIRAALEQLHNISF